MSVKLEAFLSLEESLSSRLQDTFARVTTRTFASIQSAIEAKDWAGATRLAQTIDFQAVADENDAYIKYLSQMAAMFGASRVNRKPGTSRVGLNYEAAFMEDIIVSFKRAITVSARGQVIATALQLIAIARAKEDPKVETGGTYLARVLKAGKAPALLPFQSFMNKQGKSVFQIASSLHTSRMSSFGFTAEADYLGITEYQITEQLDGRGCEVCALMHGKVFRVKDARNLLDIVVRTQDPDELKFLQPWPSQTKEAIEALGAMSAAQLVGKGWHVPPFHPRCRGLLTASGKATPLDQPEPEEEPVYEATVEEFTQFGIHLSPTKLQTWNTLMQSPPSSVIAKLLGLSQEDLLATMLAGAGPKDIGLANLSITSTGVKLEVNKSWLGSALAIVQNLIFRKDKSLYVGLIDLGSSGVPALRSTMLGLYQTAKTTTMESIRMTAASGMEGWAFAKYGFAPTQHGWYRLRKAILDSPHRMAIITDAPTNVAKAAMLALESSDPKSLFALADLSIGKKLLNNIPWAGIFDIDDPESVVRFMATVGSK